MSDMRDINPYPDETIITTPAGTDLPGERLSDFHVSDEAEPGSNTAKIVGGVAVALLLGVAGVYAYAISQGAHAAKPAVTQTASNAPATQPAIAPPPAPVQDQTAATPPSAPAPAMPPSNMASKSTASSDAAPIHTASATVTHSMRSARSHSVHASEEATALNASPSASDQSAGNSSASVSGSVSGSAAVQTPAVQPTYPSAPSSAVASTGVQSGSSSMGAPETATPAPASVPDNSAPAAQPAQPQPAAPAPDQAQQQQPAQPAQ